MMLNKVHETYRTKILHLHTSHYYDFLLQAYQPLGPIHTGEVFQRISVKLHFKNMFLDHNSGNYQSKNDFLYVFSNVKIVFTKFNYLLFANFTEFI